MSGRVLVVDDDPVFLAFAWNILADALPPGYALHQATSVREAVPLLRRWAQDGDRALVLTDFLMPGGSGLDLITGARQAFAHADFRYICITSIEHRSVLARVEHQGARTAVKPHDPKAIAELLRSTLKEWLAQAPHGRAQPLLQVPTRRSEVSIG